MAQHTVSLQLARQPDAQAIANMSAALIERGLPNTWGTLRVLQHIRSKESVVLVARDHEQVSGFAIMQFSDETAHLNLLAVALHAQRRGIATQLLAWLHETAVVAGTFIINLELRANNLEARRFYVAMGYCETGYVQRYYSGIEDAVRMSRNLTVRPRG